MIGPLRDPWPDAEEDLIQLQRTIAGLRASAVTSSLWQATGPAAVGGCFVAFADLTPEGERAWAAAVVWRAQGENPRSADRALRRQSGLPRQAQDVDAQTVVSGVVSPSYSPGLLALRQGRLLDEAVRSLPTPPDVLLVDATGLDHPRRAGLAVHLGAALGLPTVGVTHRSLLAHGELPESVRGARSAVFLDDEVVGYWVTTRTHARPVLAHAGWRTTAETAADLVLVASTEGARTPVPIQEARRVAREARAAGRMTSTS